MKTLAYILMTTAIAAAITAVAWDVDRPDTFEVTLECQDYVKPAQDMDYHVKVYSELNEPFEGWVAVYGYHAPTQLLEICLDKQIYLPVGTNYAIYDTVQNSYFATGYWCAYAQIYTQYPCTPYATSKVCCTEIISQWHY